MENNGCAGLPNFAGRHHGVLTRLSVVLDPPADSLYGITVAGLRFDASPVDYDHRGWAAHFLDSWPSGTPAYRTYYDRIEHGTWLIPKQAARGAVSSRT